MEAKQGSANGKSSEKGKTASSAAKSLGPVPSLEEHVNSEWWRQIFNAMRFDCRLDHVPVIMGIFGHCMELPAFDDAQPSRQPDAE